jgi:[acyl-carrier-protein] S-malonyltransferase
MPPDDQAFLFPGQGPHEPAMLDAVRSEPGLADRAAVVSAALGCDLEAELGRQGPAFLNRNAVSSLVTALVSALWLDRLRRAGAPPAGRLAGYSVGQLVALHAAGCFPFERLVEVIAARCRFMDEDRAARDGAMLGVVGVAEGPLRDLCAALTREGEVLIVSNDNAPGQCSLAGTRPAIERAAEALAGLGAKRVVRLPVSGAWHSPLLAEAARRFADYLETVPLAPPCVPVADNVTGGLLPDRPDLLRRQLALHVRSPVRWRDVVRGLVAAGCRGLVEVGHGTMLCKFGFFIDRSVRHRSCADVVAALGG